MTDLSSIEAITNAAARYDDFDFCGTLGSFINNREFSGGFKSYSQGRPSEDAYVWNTLSAIGNQIGSVLHSNVKYYVDNVSNIDTCKVQALRSMVKQLGFKYQIFEAADYLPLEVQNLMNLFSIDRNYVTRNKFLTDDMFQQLSACGALISEDSDTSAVSLYQLDLFSSYDNVSDAILGRFIDQNVEPFDASDYISCDSTLKGSKVFLNASGAAVVETAGCYVLAKDKAIQAAFPVSVVSSMNYYEHEMSAISVPASVASHLYVDEERIAEFGGSTAFVKRFNVLSSCNIRINQDQYDSYVKQLYYDLLSSFLDMTYADGQHTLVRTTFDSESYFKCGYFNQMADEYNNLNSSDEKISQMKHQYAVTGFDEISIVDAIERGEDSLDNYQGIKLKILQTEIKNRTSTSPFPLGRTSGGKTVSEYENTTRYSFYRKRKVLEYAKFIDDKYFSDLSAVQLSEYKLDDKYTEQNLKGDKRRVINGSDKGYSVNADMVEYVAQALADTTLYIEKLRQKLKLQSRKNFMKGTSNLIKFIISEYIRDYANSNAMLSRDGYSDALARLLSVDTSNVDVQEYIDGTEYYNISTDVSRYSKNYEQEQMNSRFFEQFIGIDENNKLYLKKAPEYFGYDDIVKFYLDGMSLVDTEDNRQLALRMLSSVYDIGANRTYVSADDVVHSRMQDFQYTRDLLVKLNTVSSAYQTFLSMLYHEADESDFEFEYPSTIWQQEDQAYQHILSVTTEQHMSSVYDTYNAYYDDIISVASQVSVIQANLDLMLSSDYPYYFFKQSDCPFCYNEDSVYVNNQYRHDYFIDNASYQYSDVDEQISKLNVFSTAANNIQNHAILDTVDGLLNGYSGYSGYYSIKTRLKSNIINEITAYGYAELGSELLKTEIDNIEVFLTSKKAERTSYLQGIIDQLNSQVKELKSSYENLEEQFNATLKNAPDFSDGYMEVYSTDKSPAAYGSREYFILYDDYSTSYLANCDKTSEEAVAVMFAPVVGRQRLDRISGEKMLDTDTGTGGTTKDFAFGFLTFCTVFKYHSVDKSNLIADIDTFSEKLEKILKLMDPENNIYYGNNAAACAGCYSTFVSIKANLTQLKLTWNSIIEQLKTVFNIEYTESRMAGTLDLPYIVDLQQYLIINMTETVYAKDSVIQTYQKYLDALQVFQTEYQKHTDALTDLTTNTAYSSFVSGLDSAEFTPTFLSTLQTYTDEKDSENKVTVLERIQSANKSLTDLIDQVKAIVSDLKIFIENDVYEKYVVNLDLKIADLIENVLASLQSDVNNRIADANHKIKVITDIITNDVYANAFNKYVFDQNDQKWSSTDYYLREEVEQYISSVNFFAFDEYENLIGLKNEYGTISSSVSPYYNYKNTVHPSFQTHPFMFNFQPQTLIRETDFTKSYINVFDQTFSFDNIDKCIDTYIGEFGQSIDIWKTNSIDYTGYVTQYEKSSHTNDNNVSCAVIDYEGAFFPPAVEDFRKAAFVSRLLNTVISSATREKIVVDTAMDVVVSADYTTSELSGIVYGHMSPYYDYNEEQCGEITRAFVSSYYSEDPDEFCQPVSRTYLSAHLLSTFNQTFYEKYYGHLGLMDNDLLHIAGQLSTYRTSIFDVTDNHRLSDVYDIYKYGKDKYYNNYVLYKRYGNADPTYQQKKDTRGELWIRLKDHPIAFPAISPAPNTLSDFTFTNIELSSAEFGSDYVNDYVFRQTNNIELSGKCFYDFEFSQENDILLLVHDYQKKFKDPGRTKDYAHANVSQTYVVKLEDSLQKRVIYGFNGQTESSNNSAVKETHNSDLYTNVLDELKESDTRFALIGTFNALNDSMKILAVSFPEEGVQHMTGATLRVYTANKSNMNFIERTVVLNQEGCLNNLVAFNGYEIDNNAYLDLVMYRDTPSHDGTFMSYNGAATNIARNSSGEPFDNTYASEINSHDVFAGDIVMNTYRLTEGSVSEVRHMSFNTNADMSYIPSYPGLSGMLRLSAEYALQNADHFQIELLGDSKNIDQAVLGVNPDADPYLTDGDMYEQVVNANGDVVSSNVRLNGRVYEDYSPSADNSLHVYKNEYMKYEPGTSPAKLVIDIDLTSEPYRYTDDDLWDMYVLIYNTNCSGKNPYFAGKLRDLNKIEKNYNSGAVSYGNDVRVVASDYTSNFDCTVGGTFQLGSQWNYDNNNHIQNVKDIVITYDKTGKKLKTEFMVDDAGIECGIASDTVRFCFYNEKMLNQFKHYHMLDVYGIVKSQKAPTDDFADTWSVHYTDLDRFQSSYYIDPETGKPKFLKDIDLGKYDYLSDVYIISPNLSSKHIELAFKVGEELAVSSVLDSQYYPTLNTCYPYNTGFYFAKDMSDISAKTLLDDSNVYILDLENGQAILDNLGNVDIPVMLDDTNDIRVFEDYNDTVTDIPEHEEPGSMPNYDRYCDESVKFNQYVHYSETSSNGTGYYYGKNLSVDTEGVEFAQLSAAKSEAYENTAKREYITIRDIAEQGLDINHLLRVYANYKYENKKIYLYFNYMNMLNTPFEKYDSEQRQVADIKDRTYLKLAPGEDGYLDINLQFKYYIRKKLYGYVNGTVLTYRIFNISDDKPKFIIRKVYQPSQYEKNNAGVFQKSSNRTIRVSIPDRTIGVNDSTIANVIRYCVSIEASEKLSSSLEFDVKYPAYMLSCLNYAELDPTASYDTPGLVHLTYEPGEAVKELLFSIRKADMERMAPYLNVPIAVQAEALTYPDDGMSIEAQPGSVTFVSDTTPPTGVLTYFSNH